MDLHILDVSSHPRLLQTGKNILAIQGINAERSATDFLLSKRRLLGLSSSSNPRQAGDADMDLDFDQLDLVQVRIAAKYLTGQPATWGEGDGNGVPGGFPGSPPEGDGVFNQRARIIHQTQGARRTVPRTVAQTGR